VITTFSAWDIFNLNRNIDAASLEILWELACQR